MNTAGDVGLQPSTPLSYRVGEGADAVAIADAVVAVWRDVDAALRPIIGQRGVVALFNRSVHLTAAAHPWLAPGRQDPAREIELESVQPLFAGQSVAQALSCANRWLQTFHQLLSSLIGASLTERLLRPTWGPPSDGLPSQDPSP